MRTSGRACFPERWRKYAVALLRGDTPQATEREALEFEMWWKFSAEGRAWSYWAWITGWLQLNHRLGRRGEREKERLRNIRIHARHMRDKLHAAQWAEVELPYLRAVVESKEMWIEFLWPLAQDGLSFRPEKVRKAQFLKRARSLNFASREALMRYLNFEGEFDEIRPQSLNEWANEYYGKRRRGRPQKK